VLTSDALQHSALPLTLTRLRGATDEAERDDAWSQFVAAHSSVVLQACRHVLHNHDAMMDGYAFVLEALREDGCQRLRTYEAREGTSFRTWLLVVARRLALDYYRHRYGRSRSETEARQSEQATRRRLEDLLADEVDPESIEDAAREEPDAHVRRDELRQRLRASLEELDPRDRLLLALRYGDERPARQIATVLHLPSVFHVYRRLNVVLRQLREALRRRGVEGPEP
jgi:RNA polymerase sigma factor (sigma-70 family)